LHAAAHERRVVALTGATGFVGQVLVGAFLEAGYQVRALVRTPSTIWPHNTVERVQGDLANRDALARLCRGAELVVHLAGAIAGRMETDFVRVNAVGTRNLTDALEHSSTRARLIHVSSLAARMPSLSAYACSKHLSEQIVRSSRLDWIILRPPAIYGPGDPALAPLWRMLARGWLLQAGPNTGRFSLLHVDDLCSAMIALAQDPAWPPAQTLSLDDGRLQGYSWAELGDIAALVGGRRVRRIKISKTLLQVLASINLNASRLFGHTPLISPGKVRELTHPDWVCRDNGDYSIPGWQAQRSLDRALLQLPGWNTA